MICRKCDASGTVLLRKEYWYCDDCFIINTNHKFRACLGKSKTLSPHEKILICLSSSASSIALLDLVHNGICLKGNKTLRIVPYFLHIVETGTEAKIANSIIDKCKKYDFNIYVININEYYSTKNILPEPNVLLTINSENTNHLNEQVPSTLNNDIIIKMKRNLFLRIANELQCKIIFTAETTTELAMKLLCNLAIGRGSQVENDVGFIDKRHKNIKILRPMRDISNEEIEYFVNIKQLESIDIKNNEENSLQTVIESFVLDLQENYPSTISTVCKTADKIGSLVTTTSGKNCMLCQSNIELTSAKLTAVEATIFSRQMCFRPVGATDKIENIPCNNEDKNPMFPNIYKTLCYSCSRNFSETEKLNISLLPSSCKN